MSDNIHYIHRFRTLPAPTPVELKALRRRLNMTQTMFARTFHLHVESLRKWEQGKATPEYTTVVFLRLIMNEPEWVMATLQKIDAP